MKDGLEPFHAAVKALSINMMRSALTALGIIIGVSAVIIVVSLVGGLEKSVLKEIEKAGSQTLYVSPVSPYDLPPEEFSRIKSRDLTLEDMKALQRTVSQVTQVTPIFYSNMELKANGHISTVQVIMTDDTYIELNGLNQTLGRNFVPSDLRLGNKVIIIGPKLLETLAIKGNPIGRMIQTPSMSLEIIGVLETQGSTLGQDQDSNAIIPLSTGMSVLSAAQRRQLMFQARINPKITAEEGADLVKDALRRIKGIKPKDREGFEVSSAKQITDMVGNITGVIGLVAGGMVSIALLVGGIGIMNIMLVSVTERTREIGVRKAVGAKRRDILLQFLIEAALLAVLGGAVGITFGYIVGAILSKAMLGVTGSVPLWAVLAAFGVPALIGMIFGLYPAAKASKLDPIEALRFE